MAYDILDKTTTILREHKLCCNCLGRMFGMLATGLTNKERGEAIITMLVMNADEMLKKSEKAKADKIIEEKYPLMMTVSELYDCIIEEVSRFPKYTYGYFLLIL
ncbi:MAG: hypothetical protein QW739_04615, partial [Candidatus Odinarchaeota archaeon]